MLVSAAVIIVDRVADLVVIEEGVVTLVLATFIKFSLYYIVQLEFYIAFKW